MRLMRRHQASIHDLVAERDNPICLEVIEHDQFFDENGKFVKDCKVIHLLRFKNKIEVKKFIKKLNRITE